MDAVPGIALLAAGSVPLTPEDHAACAFSQPPTTQKTADGY